VNGDLSKTNPFGEKSQAPVAFSADPAARRPGVLTAVCVIAILVGLLGVLSGISKLFNALFGARMQQMFAGFGAVNAEMREAQERMYATLTAAMEPFLIPNLILAVAQLLLCGVLVYGAAKTLKLQEQGRRILATTAALLLLFEVGQGVVQGLMQMRMMPVMERHMSDVMQATPGAAPGAGKLGQALGRVSIVAGLVFQIAWMLIKLGYYGFTVRYLRRDRVRALCAESAPIAAELS